ncbi:probable fatty acyl-CoA reductase 4 isoform X2 [Prosopis cineraria]|uniref:probable fatty acyl-CoA reductase 4 isoform X2 n=1 Tax=Prosopis cineraria TaxID=364024 RepID=UPI002410A845|nr:probable fatty acyl-CoA reductase 4 isoform X2 [Prosopis cineraria]XP_054813656.1 probable fatty acyl-CoA reductase 4 isoform X2 [Prosopis cineraria]
MREGDVLAEQVYALLRVHSHPIIIYPIFIEKLLRTQPDLKKLYLLLRASDSNAATQRLHDEIMGKELFRVLRDKMGADFDSFMSEKVKAIAGDVSLVNLGLDENVRNKITEEIDVIVNSAATTKFDERFDLALSINTMGALHILNFAKSCPKIQAFLHVSTAYVCGEATNEKVVKEEPIKMGQTIKGNSKLDIQSEKELMEKRMKKLEAENVGEKAMTSAMSDYGMERANFYGWPNPYVFTKAMGEMILSTYKDNVPLIIIRPSVITSTIKEPFRGWIEGFRTIDSIIGGHGKGTISNFLGDPTTIMGVIPVDMVTNCMVAATVIHSINQDLENFVYHVCSSSRNPIRLSNVCEFSNLYFSKNPLTNKTGSPITISKLRFLSDLDFQTLLIIQYVLPLKVLNLVSNAFFHVFEDWYSIDDKRVQLLIRMAKLFKPYLFFKAVFDDTNTQKLSMITKMENVEFDPKSIDWTDYMMNVHIPGLVKFVIKLFPKL